jgi:SNF2 family DNA or RNA helicase
VSDAASTSEDMKLVLKQLTELQSEFHSASTNVDAAYKAYVKAQAAKNQMKDKLAEIQREIARLNKLQEANDLLAKRKAELQEFEERYISSIKAVDELTATAKWREFAFDHQIEAGKRIAYGQGFILADTMGLGKSLSSIIAVDMIKAYTRNASPDSPIDNSNGLPVIDKPCGKKVLYLCPKPLINNVRNEFKQWAPKKVVFFLNSNNLFPLEMARTLDEFVIVTNYEVWRRNKDIVAKLIGLEFDTLIVDESHNMKEANTVTARTIKNIATTGNIPYRLLMTGTPILNKPDDLFTSLNMIAPASFPRLNNFMWQYCQQRYVEGRLVWTFRPGGTEALLKKVGYYLLKRTKEDAGIILPPLTVEEHLIERNADEAPYDRQWKLYEEMRKYGIAEFNKESHMTAAAMIAVLTRLRQLILWPSGIQIEGVHIPSDIDSQKMDYTIELIEEIARHKKNPDGERTVVFSQFVGPLKAIQTRLLNKGYKVGLMIGATSEAERAGIIEDLNIQTVKDGGHYDVVLCNYKVGGIGLNFTDATSIVVLDQEWNPGKRDQAYGRLHRMGQVKPVTVHKVLVANSVDSWLETVMETKAKLLAGFEDKYIEFSAKELSKGLEE